MIVRKARADGEIQCLCDGISLVGEKGKAAGVLFVAVVIAGTGKGGAGRIAGDLGYQQRVKSQSPGFRRHCAYIGFELAALQGQRPSRQDLVAEEETAQPAEGSALARQ